MPHTVLKPNSSELRLANDSNGFSGCKAARRQLFLIYKSVGRFRNGASGQCCAKHEMEGLQDARRQQMQPGIDDDLITNGDVLSLLDASDNLLSPSFAGQISSKQQAQGFKCSKRESFSCFAPTPSVRKTSPELRTSANAAMPTKNSGSPCLAPGEPKVC